MSPAPGAPASGREDQPLPVGRPPRPANAPLLVKLEHRLSAAVGPFCPQIEGVLRHLSMKVNDRPSGVHAGYSF